MAKVTRLTLDSSGGLERRSFHLREISDATDQPLETVGLDLRKARQRKGEDLAHIAQILKIRRDYLDALEESQFDAMPGTAYTIGFVRTYAQYLGLDARDCVERIKTEIAGRSDVRDGTVQVSSPQERSLPRGGVVFAVLLGIALIYGVYYLFVAVNHMTSQPVTPVPPRLAAQAGLATADNPVSPVLGSPATAAAGTVGSVQNSSVLPEGHKYGVQADSRITLLAHKPAHVTVSGADRHLVIDQQLQPGDSYFVPNIHGLTLSTSDSGALEVILDGNTMGYVGENGLTSEGLSLDPQDVAEHKARG